MPAMRGFQRRPRHRTRTSTGTTGGADAFPSNVRIRPPRGRRIDNLLSSLERLHDLRLRGPPVFTEQSLLTSGPHDVIALLDCDRDRVEVDAVRDDFCARVN